MYLINHFLDEDIAGILVPDKSQASQTNGVSGTGSLGQQVDTCVAQYNRDPNFMLVDVSFVGCPCTHILPLYIVLRVRRWFSLPGCGDCQRRNVFPHYAYHYTIG